MKINSKIKWFLVLSVILFILSVTALTVIWVFIDNNTRTIFDIAQSRLIEKEKNMRYASLRNTLASNEEKGIDLKSFLVSEDNPVEFIEIIENTSQREEVNAEIGSVIIKKSNTKTKNVNSIEMAITASGNWSRVMRFVSAIELLPYDISITSIELVSMSDESAMSLGQNKQKSSGENIWKVSFKMEALTYKNE